MDRHGCATVTGRDGTAHRPRAVNLMEVLVVTAALALIMAILLPSFKMAREQVRRVYCANNLRQWGVALHLYAQRFRGYFPTEGTFRTLDKPGTWFNVLPPLLRAPRYIDVERQGKQIKEFPNFHVFICPAKARSENRTSKSGMNQFHYGMNQVIDGTGDGTSDNPLTPGFPDRGERPLRLDGIARPETTVFMFDICPNSPNGNPRDVATKFHHDYANVTMFDGHVDHFRGVDFVVGGNVERFGCFGRDAVPVWDHPQLFWGYRPGPSAP